MGVFSKTVPSPPPLVVRGTGDADVRAWELLYEHLNERQRKEILEEHSVGFVVKGEQNQWLIEVDGGVGRLAAVKKLVPPKEFFYYGAVDKCIVPQYPYGLGQAPWCDYLLALKFAAEFDERWLINNAY